MTLEIESGPLLIMREDRELAAERMRRWHRRVGDRQAQALVWLGDHHAGARPAARDRRAYEAGVYLGVKAMVAMADGGRLSAQLANAARDALLEEHRRWRRSSAASAGGAGSSSEDVLLGMCDGAYFELNARSIGSEVSLDRFRHLVVTASAASGSGSTPTAGLGPFRRLAAWRARRADDPRG